ncbi:MAG: FKBP-type peptidyl-prolyl cis-trans isomerase [Paludibacteraceae bacterium]
MKKSLIFLFIFGSILFLSSCVKQQAQFPSNKEKQIDSTDINLRTINETLTLKEDSIIHELVRQQKNSYIKTPSGAWYYKESVTSLDSLKESPQAVFSYTLYTLTGEKISIEKKQVTFGKKEIPSGLEEGLKLMRKGEKIRLIVPWYLAYGMRGQDNIPPYTSLVYEITAK